MENNPPYQIFFLYGGSKPLGGKNVNKGKNMNKSKIIPILCAVMLLALALALLVSCDTTGTQYHYDYLVTFDYNVDNLKDANGDKLETASETEYLGVKEGSKLVAPGSISEIVFQQFEIKGYFIEGWYTAEFDSQGNPVKDTNGDIVLKNKWNFETDTVSSNMTLYANLVKKVQFRIVTSGSEYVVIDGQPGRVIEQGEVESVVKKDGWTFMNEIYRDAKLSQKMTFPYTLTDTDFTCYAKMMQGTWKFANDPDSFLQALSTGKDIYINAAELDFTGKPVLARNAMTYFGREFYGKIQGNGCVIKNLDINIDCTRNVTSRYALFQTLGSTAEISGLTFQNVSITVTVNQLTTSDFKTAFFAVEIEDGARLTDVTFSECSLNLIGGTNAVLENLDETMQNNGYYYHSNETFDCFNEGLTVTNNVVQG